MKRLSLLPVLLASSIFFFSGCGGGSTESTTNIPGVTDSTIVVGTWGPLTGPAALWGGVSKGIDAYLKMINDEGGINGRRFKLILKDDAYDPSKTVPVVREMVEKDEVFAFVGGIGTANGLAVMDYIGENEIPWIAPISGSAAWAYPPKENVFSIYTLYFDEAEAQVMYALDSLRASKIAIIYQNDDFGKSGLVAARYNLSKKDLSLAAEVSVEITDTDLSTHAARLQESGAEIVLLWTAPRQAAIILGTTAAMGYQPQWITSTVLSDMQLMYDITKGAWQGVISAYFQGLPLATDYNNPTVAKYRDAMKKYYPDERWSVFPMAGFFYADPLVEAIRRAGDDLSREHLIRTLEGFNNIHVFNDSGPSVSFGPGQRQGLRGCIFFRCLGPEQAEILTGTITPTSDPNELLRMLHEN